MAATTFEIPEILTEEEIEKKAAEKKAAEEAARLKEEAEAAAKEAARLKKEAEAKAAEEKAAEKAARLKEEAEEAAEKAARLKEEAEAAAEKAARLKEEAEAEAEKAEAEVKAPDSPTEKNHFPIGKFALGSGAALLGWVGYAVERAKQAQEAAKNILEANMDVLGQGGAGLADKIQNLTPKDAEQWLGYTGVPTAGMDEQQIMSTATEKMREVAQQAEQAHDQVLQALHDGGINVSPEEYYAHLRQHPPEEMINALSDFQPDMLRGAMEHIGNVVETLDKSGVLQALAFVSTAHAAMQLAGSAREAVKTNDSSKLFNWDNAGNLLRIAGAGTPTLVLAVHLAQAATQAAIHFSKDSTLKEAQDARDSNAAFIDEITKQMEDGNKSWENRYRAITAQLNGFKIAATCKAAETMNEFRNFFEKTFLNTDETPQPTVEEKVEVVDPETIDPTVASQRDESGGPTIEIPEEMIKAIETIDPKGDFGVKDCMDMVKAEMSEGKSVDAELYLVTLGVILDNLRASGKLTPEQTGALDNFNTFLHDTVAAQVYGVDGVAKFEEGKLYECVDRLDAALDKNNDTIFKMVYALQEGKFDFHDPSAVQDLGEVMHKIRYGGSFFTTEAKQVVEYVQQAFADANQAEALNRAMDSAMYADLHQHAMFQENAGCTY